MYERRITRTYGKVFFSFLLAAGILKSLSFYISMFTHTSANFSTIKFQFICFCCKSSNAFCRIKYIQRRI